jgi:hypothetical protein
MKDVEDYNNAQTDERKTICELLASEINKGLPKAESKIWHGSPVWFLDSNPVVGYAARKNWINLLFWSGQSFEEPGLMPEGSFKAAEAHYTDVSQINKEDLARWLDKAQKIQWGYKNIVKRRGKLERLS